MQAYFQLKSIIARLGFTTIVSILAILSTGMNTHSAFAQNRNQEADAYTTEREHWIKHSNTGSIRIITKGLGCTCTDFASDMSKVMNDLGRFRILPVLGTGSLQGIADVLYLKGIDLSILQSDVYEYVRRNKIHSHIEQRIRYVTKLHNSELHLIAGQGIERIEDLEGKVVSFDAKGRGSFITAQNVFSALGINVKSVRLERDLSIEKVRTGELAAAFVVTGKPATSMNKIKPGNGLHFLPVPFHPSLKNIYLPSELTSKDYPNLIQEGQKIPTIAVSEVLAVYNWKKGTDRYATTKEFIDAFFDNFDQFRKPIYHKKWHEVDLEAPVPGWIRFPAATEKLAEMKAAARNKGNTIAAAGISENKLDRHFNSFIQAQVKEGMSEDDAKKKLYENFKKWLATKSE